MNRGSSLAGWVEHLRNPSRCAPDTTDGFRCALPILRLSSPLPVNGEDVAHTLRHCERSEAIQSLSAEGIWIASLRSQ
jgi:hypothetical protein